MNSEEQLELVKQHYALNSAGDFAAAGKLLTEDFSIMIPPSMPFAGTYRGKGAFRELIPIVANAVPIVRLQPVATTVGGDYAVELVEFTLAGDDGPPFQVAEVFTFQGNQIREVRPYYFDPTPMVDAIARKAAAASSA